MTDENVRQSHVNEHFKVATPEDNPQPYSDEIFNEAVREWLIETNQVCYFTLIFVSDLQHHKLATSSS